MTGKHKDPPSAEALFVRPPETGSMRDPLGADWNQGQGVGESPIGPIDFGLLNSIFEDFLAVVGLPVAVIDLEGKVLASSRWQRLCMEFHRVHPTTLARCLESDVRLSREMAEGRDYSMYQCRNGLTDCATPIVVDGRHVANLFVGQFLIAPPEGEDFRHIRKQCGFDPEAYDRALAEVPIVAEEKLPAILRLMGGLARQIASQSLAEQKARAAHAAVEKLVIERTAALEVALEQIRRSEERYRVLFTSSKVPMLLIDPGNCAIVDANLAAEAYYGHDGRTLRAMRVQDIYTLSPAEVAEEMARAASEARTHVNFRHRLADGQIRDVEIHSGPLEMGGRTLLYSIIHDVSDRKRLEAERRRLVLAIEQSPVSIVITDRRGVIEYVNPAFTRITGYRLDEAVGQTPRILKSGETSDEEYARMWAGLTAGHPWTGRFRNKRKDGSMYWEEAQISPVFDEDGQITSFLAIKEDITARKEAEEESARRAEELAHSNAELEQFAYVASHDLRQPLRMVNSYLGLIERRYADRLDDDGREFIAFARNGALQMDRLILDLLEYSRVGRLASAPEDLDLAEIAADAALQFQPRSAEAGAEITIQPGPAPVTGSRSELARLMQNLIGNALKYRSPDRAPRIQVTWRDLGESWEVGVTDNGIGIAPEYLQDIFKVFRRLHTAQEYEGTGIGLAICQKIVKHHGGRIWAVSIPGEGSTFRFTIAKRA